MLGSKLGAAVVCGSFAVTFFMVACVTTAFSQEINVRLELEPGGYSVSGVFNGERWTLPGDFQFDFVDGASPENASRIADILRSRYRACQGGSLQSTLPLTSEYRFLVMLSGTERIVQDDDVVRFEAASAESITVDWQPEFADGEPARENVILSGPGIYILPLGADASAIVNFDGSICGNQGSVDNCGSAGCGMSISLNGERYSLVAHEPYSTFDNGRWYLHVPRSLNSTDPQRFEYANGELVGWVYE